MPAGVPLEWPGPHNLHQLHVVAFDGMLDGAGGPCEHPLMVFIIGTATALSGSMVAVAPFGTATPTTPTTPAATTAPAATTTQQLHLVELDVGIC